MVEGIVYGMISAWILTAFNVDEILLQAANSFFGLELNRNHYYTFFAAVGMIQGIITDLSKLK